MYFAPRDPAQAGIARYKAESARPRPAATGLRPLDRVARSEPTATGWTTSPAVWEWTNSCFVRISLDGERERITNTNDQHQLRRPRRGGSPSFLYDRLHPRSQVRRLRRGRPAGQSRLQARRRTLPVGRHVRRPERHKAAAANIAVSAIGSGLSQRKVLPLQVR